MKKLISVLLLACIVMTFAAGCDSISDFLTPADKTFTKSGMSITLTEEFAEKEYVSYTSTYESTDIAVYTLKEEFTLFGGVDYSLDAYTDLVISANGMSEQVQHKDGLTYFTYQQDVNGKSFQYYAFTYKGEDAYWLIQFACTQDNSSKLESDIFQYAKSVEV